MVKDNTWEEFKANGGTWEEFVDDAMSAFVGEEIWNECVVKYLRLKNGISQKALAEAAGINVRQVQKIESGEIALGNVTLANAKKLADALGVTVDVLARG